MQVITPNPKTSGNGKWSFLAMWGSVVWRKPPGQPLAEAEAEAERYVGEVFKRVPVLDPAARGATLTFAQKKIGDVHLTWENEAHLEVKEANGELEIVYPPVSVLAEPHVAVVDRVVDRKGTRTAAEAYLRFLFTEQAQEVIAKHYHRPTDPRVFERWKKKPDGTGLFPELRLERATTLIDRWQEKDERTNWDELQKKFFAEGGGVRQDPAGEGGEMRLSPRGRVLPGFGLGLGISLLYLSLLVLLPLAACGLKAAELSPDEFRAAVWNDRAVAAYQLTFGASLQAALINVPLGLIVAWTLVRYEFPGKRIVDALVDVPFALPTAVAGLVYGSLYVKSGWLGQFLVPLGFEGAYSTTGIVLVLVFTGFPFVVRTVQPVLEDMDAEFEQAAATLGSSKWQTFRRVILPTLVPPTLTGFTLAFARAVGEYGSVIFVSSNIRGQTEIAPVLIVSRLEEFAYKEAAAVAVLLLCVSFLLLGIVNLLERWTQPGSAPRLMRAPFRLAGRGLEAASSWAAGQGVVKLLGRVFAPVGWFVIRHLKWLMIGATVLILGSLVAVPLANVFAQAFSQGPFKYVEFLVNDPDTRHAMFLTAIVAPLAVAMNTVFGIAAAYTVARFRFPGRTLLTTLIDLPFSVSPVVAGLVLVLVFGGQSPLGSWLKDHGFQVIFSPPGLVLATAFVTFPFVARELLPVMEATGPDEELAARSLGANAWQMFWRVTLPNIKWGLLYGVILCNARAMGEFGAIYVVSGRIAGQTDTMPLRVEKLIQEYNQPAAFAVASVLTLLALVTLGAKAALERKVQAERARGGVSRETTASAA